MSRFANAFSDADVDRPADCVIFSCASLGYDGLDAFNEFGRHDNTKDVPAILITSEKQESLAREAKLAPKRVQLDMPLKLKQLRKTLRSLLDIPTVDAT